MPATLDVRVDSCQNNSSREPVDAGIPALNIQPNSLDYMPDDTLTESESSVKKIPLTQGKFAIVDAVDFEYLSQWKWHAAKSRPTHRGSAWYARRTGTRKENLYMHNDVVLNAGWESGEYDHKDGDGLNNQRNNLRPCTHSQNNANRAKWGGTTSAYKGVSRCVSRNSWEARLGRKFLGRFEYEVDAALAYDQAAKLAFKEFARLNFQ